MSGSTVGGIVGGAIGFVVSGYNPQGFQIGWMVGSAVGGYVDPDVIKGPRLRDAQMQTSMEGAPRAIVFGVASVAGNIIQSGPLVEHKRRQRTGKGGPVQETFTYTRSYAIRVCEGPIAGIRRVWRDGKLAYDARDPSTRPDWGWTAEAWAADIERNRVESAKFAQRATFYRGDEEQLPDPTLEAIAGVGNVPAYRGSAYVVIANDDLTDRQGTIPQYTFEVVSCGETVPGAAGPSRWYLTVESEFGVVLPGEGPYNWGTETITPVVSGAPLTRIVTGAGKALFLRANSGIVSADGAQTFVALTGLPADTIGGGLYALNTQGTSGVFVLWHNSGVISRSFDGQAFDVNAVALSAFNINVVVQVRFTAFGQPGSTLLAFDYVLSRSADLGETWEREGDFFFDSTHKVTAAATLGTHVLVGGEGGKLKVSSDSGNTFNAIESPFDDTTSDITDALSNGLGFVIRNAAGEVAYGVGTFLKAPVTIVPAGPRFGCADEGVFVLPGVDGQLAVSDSGQFWEFITTPYFGGAVDLLGVAGPGPLSGYAVPDLPGWYVNPDGSLSGPAGEAIAPCGDETVADVVRALCHRVGIVDAQLEVSQLTDRVRGFVVGRPMSASDAIRALQPAYSFDFPEWDLMLRGIKRGGPSLFTITDDDLVESDDDEDTRAQAVEFPRKVNLVSPDPSQNYESPKETAARRTDNIKAVGELTVELPIVQLPDERAQCADKMLRIAWAKAEGRCQFQLPEEFSAMTASDPFTKDGKRWIADRVEYGDGVVKVEATRDRVSAYESSATGTAGEVPTPSPGSVRGPTMFAAMNLPRLRSADNVPGMYLAVCGWLDGWIGSDIYLAVDGGDEQLVATMLDASIMGTLTAALAADGDTLAVKLFNEDELESATPTQIAARQNAFAITTDGVQEIGQFATPTDTGDKTYDLTGLTRGGLGTGAAAHGIGEQFVVLDGALLFLPIDIRHAGKTLTFRPVSRGTDPDANPTHNIVFDPQFTGPETLQAIKADGVQVAVDDVPLYLVA